MSALPILARELRSRARKPWTAWLRVLVGLFATLMAAGTLTWAHRFSGMGSQAGKMLFESLTATLFVFCLVEGVRQTADCLSQEKREGTLGLLFLTELSGLDVVLGKLAATSLGSFFALLAAFPIMAVAFVAGGVTAGEFWRSVLVLLNVLFTGLAWGMWASARHRVEGRGMLLGLGAAFAFTLVPWVFELALQPAGLPNISLSVALHLADDTVYGTSASRFWMTLGLTHGLSWVLLVAAGRIVELDWREEESLPAAPTVPLAQSPGSGGDVIEPARIQEYWPVRMQDDPAGWLARRRLRHRHVIWLSLVTLGLGPHLAWMLVIVMMRTGTSTGGLHNAIDLAGTFLPVMLLLFITSRCFAEARRGGEMELLLSTPLSARALVLGQWRALWQRLRAPLIVTAALAGFITIVSLLETDWPFGSVGGSFGVYQTAQCAKNLLCGVAACWLGLYLGLRTESVLRAVGYGLLWLVVGPWIGLSAIWFLSGLLFPATFVIGLMLVWVLPVAINWFYLAGILWWSRRQLIERL